MGAVILSAVMYTKATNWKLVWRGLDGELGRYGETKTFLIIKIKHISKEEKKTYCPLLKQLLLYIYGGLAVVQLVNRRIIMCTWFFSGEKSV